MGSSGKYAGKSKGLAIVLALFLGGLGIHKFYLRRIWLGLLYLLFCWTLIPVLLGVIDAIVLAAKNRREFSGDVQPSKADKNSDHQQSEASPINNIREDLRRALEMDGVNAKALAFERYRDMETHLPVNTKVLCCLDYSAVLLLDTGILKLEPKSMFSMKTGFKGAKLIPFTDIAKVSVAKKSGSHSVNIKIHKNRGEFSFVTFNSENAYKFEELLLGMIPASTGHPKLREDFARALGVSEDYVPTDLDWTIESFIPSDSKVIFLLKPGFFILLDNGVLKMKLNFLAPISGAEFVPLSQIRGVTVTDRNPGAEYNPQYAVDVRRDEGTVVIAGSSFKTNDFFGLTEIREEAVQFQDLLLGLMKPSATTASDIKELLEKLLSSSGKSPAEKLEELSNLRYQNLLSDQEFELAKSKILGI
jgi:TM2 domain-containing membrane protein YozV